MQVVFKFTTRNDVSNLWSRFARNNNLLFPLGLCFSLGEFGWHSLKLLLRGSKFAMFGRLIGFITRK